MPNYSMLIVPTVFHGIVEHVPWVYVEKDCCICLQPLKRPFNRFFESDEDDTQLLHATAGQESKRTALWQLNVDIDFIENA